MSSTVRGVLIIALLISIVGVLCAGDDLSQRVFWLQAECTVLAFLWIFHG